MAADCCITLNVVEDHIIYEPNRWANLRSVIRQPLAEFLGTVLLVTFGLGGTCQVALSSLPDVSPSGSKGDYLSSCIGWSVGVCLGVWVAGGISGGHLNPAVTLAFAVFRRLPWVKATVYCVSQVLGAFAGAAIVYGNYSYAIDLFEGSSGLRTIPGTAQLFASFPPPSVPSATCFFSEFIGTALFVLSVFALVDSNNCAPPPGLVPIALGLVYVGIGSCFGLNTGWSINPARDLGGRLVASAAGYGSPVWTYNAHYWLWGPICGALLGGLAGGLVYDLLCFTGRESIINRMNTVVRLPSRERPGLHARASGSFDGKEDV